MSTTRAALPGEITVWFRLRRLSRLRGTGEDDTCDRAMVAVCRYSQRWAMRTGHAVGRSCYLLRSGRVQEDGIWFYWQACPLGRHPAVARRAWTVLRDDDGPMMPELPTPYLLLGTQARVNSGALRPDSAVAARDRMRTALAGTPFVI